MSLTVLNVAYPFAPVGPDAVGGAEQVLSTLDRALVAAGHRSLVVACEGSRVAGSLVEVALPHGLIGAEERRAAHAQHRAAIAAARTRWAVDVVHLHGVDFAGYLPADGPTLATLHLPLDWYPPGALAPDRDDLWLNPVSMAQAATAPADARLVPPIANGVDAAALAGRHARRGFALCLGRICPEKGAHLALDAARRAGVPLILAGEVFAYDAHRRYFEAEVAPRLDGMRRFAGPLGFLRKRRFLNAARCVVIPSLAAETSSLVAMEALAAGTPVVAFPNGALPEVVEHGRTGFLVGSVEEMAEAIRAAGSLDLEHCREAARRRFSLAAMCRGYFAAYEALAALGRSAPEQARIAQ